MTFPSIVAAGFTLYAAFWLGKNWPDRSGRDVEEAMTRNLSDRCASEPQRRRPKPPPEKPYYMKQSFPFYSRGGLVVILNDGRHITYHGPVTIENHKGVGIEVWQERKRIVKGYPHFSQQLVATIAAKDFGSYEMLTTAID